MPRPRHDRSRKLPALSSLELDVMNVVWDLGDCTSAQVTAEFTKSRALAPTTIRTVLAKLRDKGYLEPVPSIHRGFLWRPAVQRDSFARRSLKDLVARLLGGSRREAIAYLLDDADVTDRDLEEIRRLLDARKKKGG